MVHSAARGLAAVMGIFGTINLLAGIASGFHPIAWWIDVRPMPSLIAGLMLGSVCAFLLLFALRPRTGRTRRRLTGAAAAALLAIALVDSLRFYQLLGRGEIASSFPVPFSMMLAAAVVVVLAGLRGPHRSTDWRAAGLVAAAALVGFPLAQIWCFGRTDYRRPADVIVVFGARAYASGRCSLALEDRVRTACELYRQGYASTLVFSGAQGDGDVHETEAMRRLAVALGVPDEAILKDEAGVTTQATVANTSPMFKGRRVLAVSHAYHLPRIKLDYQRAGVEVFTVPARETRMLAKMPWFVAREVVCLWAYYVRALA